MLACKADGPISIFKEHECAGASEELTVPERRQKTWIFYCNAHLTFSIPPIATSLSPTLVILHRSIERSIGAAPLRHLAVNIDQSCLSKTSLTFAFSSTTNRFRYIANLKLLMKAPIVSDVLRSLQVRSSASK